MKQHGFARVSRWTVEEQCADSAVLSLSEDALSAEWRALFPFLFRLEYTVKVTASKELSTSLVVRNREEEKPFDFTVLFHSYFAVKAREIAVEGLKGLEFVDKLKGKEDAERIKKEENDGVRIEEEVDRIYMDIEDGDIVLKDHTKTQCPQITVKRTGFVDVVLWNPWSAKSKRMADFGDNEFEDMVCIEPGSVNKKVVLKAGESKIFTQTLVPSAGNVQGGKL